MKTKITFYLCIFISLIATSLGGFGPWRRPPKSVEIQPNTPNACSTENLTLTCTQLNNDTSKSLVFQVNNNTIPDEEITIIDNKTISYTMTNLNAARDHNAIGLCCLGPCDGSAQMTIETWIQVYDKPKPVENFRCVVHNYLDSMTCDWELVVNPTPMRVILRWKYRIFSSWKSCPSHENEDKVDNKTTCTWKSKSDGNFSHKELYFIVTVTSDCGETASSNYTINTSNMVKPLPVDDLQATVLNSRCVNVSWEPNRAHYVKHYEIYFTSIWDNGTLNVIHINDTDVDKNETKMKDICDLHPFTDYTFTVRAHPEGEGYWSDNRTIVANTCSDNKAKPVENFRCVVQNYQDSMTCDWELLVNPKPMKVILFWKTHILSSWHSCPSYNDADKSDDKTSCTWKSTTVGDFSLKKLDFIVSVMSDCFKFASSNYTFDTSNIVKPLPVDRLQATVFSSQCINVSWVPNRRAFVKRYEIYYTSIWDNGTLHVIQINDTDVDKNETKVKEICDLHPFTDYTFTVRSHPEGEGYWSDNTTITAKTYSDTTTTLTPTTAVSMNRMQETIKKATEDKSIIHYTDQDLLDAKVLFYRMETDKQILEKEKLKLQISILTKLEKKPVGEEEKLDSYI